MKRLALIAALMVAVAVPVWGQRGGGRSGGGGMGHGVTAGRGGFSMGGRSGFAGGAVAGRSGFSGGVPAFRGGVQSFRGRSSFPVRRPVNVRPVRFRAPFGAIPYSYGFPYGPDYFDSDFYGDGGTGYGAAVQPSYSDNSSQGGYDAGAGQQSSVAAPENEAYRAAYHSAQVAPAPAPLSADAVTLIFKDGRPSEQIHNYMLSRTTLYVQDGRRREIAVADLDLAATEKVNREAGVDFQLPAARR
jgi:hypothetical protein